MPVRFSHMDRGPIYHREWWIADTEEEARDLAKEYRESYGGPVNPYAGSARFRKDDDGTYVVICERANSCD